MKALAPFGVALAIGFTLLAGAAGAAPAGLAGSRPAAAQESTVVPAEQANHRWRRGGATVEFHFRGGPRYHGPRRHFGPRYYDGPRFYHGPRYVPQRQHYPRYVPRYQRPAPVSAHVNWCSAKYRSYHAWDNTFQPYRGARRQCVSPYY